MCIQGGSPWETIFTVIEEVESSGSGVACIQARTGVYRVTAAVKRYRDDPVIARTTPVLPRSEVTVHVEGRSKRYGLSVTELLFPFKICQSSFGGGGEDRWEQCMYSHYNFCWKLFSKERAVTEVNTLFP